MDFSTQLKALGDNLIGKMENIKTEEATKTGLIMPFLQTLGYDVFNPTQVVPEFTADTGVKKGEKVDYAIFQDEQPILIIECKHHSDKLTLHNTQLLRYFQNTSAKFAILTNGINYKLFSDLEEQNKMDEKPFYEFDITVLKENDFKEIEKFRRDNFDLENILNSASELKYSGEIKKYMRTQFEELDEEFLLFLIKKVYSGKATAGIKEQFTPIVKKSLKSFLSELVNQRLQSAIAKEESEQKELQESEQSEDDDDSKIVTTEEELEGFHIVKSLLRKEIEPARIFYRDTVTYFGIILDNNNRKPVCRLYFNGKKKFITIIDAARKEEKFQLETLDEIYSYEEKLLASAKSYD